MPRPIRSLRRKSLLTIGLTATVALCAMAVRAQPGFQDVLNLGGASKAQPNPEFTTRLIPADAQPGSTVTLEISVKIPPEHYIYATTETSGAKTKINLQRQNGLKSLDDAFQPDHDPKIVTEPGFGDKEQALQKFVDRVTWTRRFQVRPDVDVRDVSIEGNITYQICGNGTCRPQSHRFTVTLASAGPAVPEPASRADAGSPPTLTAPPADVFEPAGKSDEPTRFEHKVVKTTVAAWTVSLQPRQAKPGDEVTLTLTAELQPGWHVFALDQQQLPNDGGGPLQTVIELKEFGDLKTASPAFAGPDPLTKASEGFSGLEERIHEGRVVWTQRFRVPADAKPGEVPLSGAVAYQMCNARMCLPATGFTFHGNLSIGATTISEPAVLAVKGPMRGRQAAELIASAPVVGGATELAPGGVAIANARGIDKSKGLIFFLITAVLAGFAALLTPCVFPMIPITVSFFQKQSEKEHHRPVNMALVYCLGIIGTFTGLGLLISILFGAAALNGLANLPWINVFIGGMLVFFGLNLLGMFEIRIPSWLLTYTSGKEALGGFVGVLFMALTFTLTSFTCTFAFLGLLFAAAANGDRLWPFLGLLAFSAAFALPFFFLALFPSLLQKLPKSGGWMNVVKVLMGLLELGASFKFFSVADLKWHPEPWVFDFEFVMAAWIVTAVIAGIYLLGCFRLPHDTPSEHIGAFRLVSAMGCLGFAAYLSIGLFSAEKPTSVVWTNVAALAPPKLKGGTDSFGPYLEHGGLKYALDFQRAVEVAARRNLPVFIDFTGVNCANCRKMEDGPLSQPHIKARLDKFILVQLFTDRVPVIQDEREANRLLEQNLRLQQQYGDVSLPSYAVIPPDPNVLKDPARILARHIGYEPREEVFAQFLDDGLAKWQKLSAAPKAGRLVGQR